MYLIDQVKKRLRINGTQFDDEICQLMEYVEADLKSLGVLEKHIQNKDPIIEQLVYVYCKSKFGLHDNFEKFENSYNIILDKVKGMKKYYE